MTTPKRSTFSLVAFGCPIAVVGLVLAARPIDDEEAALRVLASGLLFFLLITIVALVAAFIRKEKLRWFTLLPLVLMLAVLTFGVSG